MTTLSCPHCHKPIESGQATYCPHCFLRLPGVTRAPSPAARPAGGQAPRIARSRTERPSPEPRKLASPGPRTRPEPEAKPAGQCPACAHPITTKDQWCKWCHWPVNRKA